MMVSFLFAEPSEAPSQEEGDDVFEVSLYVT